MAFYLGMGENDPYSGGYWDTPSGGYSATPLGAELAATPTPAPATWEDVGYGWKYNPQTLRFAPPGADLTPEYSGLTEAQISAGAQMDPYASSDPGYWTQAGGDWMLPGLMSPLLYSGEGDVPAPSVRFLRHLYPGETNDRGWSWSDPVGSAVSWAGDNITEPIGGFIDKAMPVVMQLAPTVIGAAVGGPAGAAAAQGFLTYGQTGDFGDAALAAALAAGGTYLSGVEGMASLPSGTGADVLGVGMGGIGEVSTLTGAQAAQAAAGASSGMLGIPENPPGIGNPYQNSTPLVYGSPEFYQAASQLGLSPEQALSLTDTSLGGISANQLYKAAGGTVPSTSTTNPYSTALKVMGQTLLAGGGGGAAGYNAISSPNLSLGTGTSNYKYNPTQFSAPQQLAGLLSSIPQRKSLSLPEDFLKPKDKQRFDLSAFRDPWSQERDKYWNYLA